MGKIAESTKRFFNEEVIKMMTKLEATEIDVDKLMEDSWEKQWMLTTQGGILLVTLPKDQKYTFTVFARFKDIDKANEVLGKHFGHNEFSGKWNFHLSHVAKPKVKKVVKGLQDMYVSVLS